jgi:hypothetical protein
MSTIISGCTWASTDLKGTIVYMVHDMGVEICFKRTRRTERSE